MEVKQFDAWNVFKQQLHVSLWDHYIREGEIWFCSIGVNIGWEEDGKNGNFERPLLVVRKLSRNYFWGVPLSTKIREGDFYYYYNLDGRSYNALLMQIRMFDCRRLQRLVATISQNDLHNIRIRITDILLSKTTAAPFGAASEHSGEAPVADVNKQ